MVKIDLITGFLGSGKTTFLRRYATELMNKGENICILENDFGAVNVDMMLLKDLIGDLCDMEMVAGGCDADCHKRRFKTKLIAMGMQGFDRVLMEPSGIYDSDEFFDTLREDPLDRWYEIGTVYAIVDAKLEKTLSEEARYLLASQLANAGVVVLSRIGEATEEEILSTIDYINEVMKEYGCTEIPDERIIKKSWEMLTTEDFREMQSHGYQAADHKRVWFDQREAFTSKYFLNLEVTPLELEKRIVSAFADEACGNIFRIKGFAKDEEGAWWEMNGTRHGVTVKPIPEGQDVIIVIGENLSEERLGTHLI